MRLLGNIFAILLAGALTVSAQTPIPIVVAAATPATNAPAAAKPTPVVEDSSTLKMLQEMKTANEETLRKQEAALQQLDELQKAADQIRIYTKRG